MESIVPNSNVLNWNAFVFYVKQIPYGQCITEKKLLQFLQGTYHNDKLHFEPNDWPLFASIDPELPLWRCLSTKGLSIQPDHCFVPYAEKLIDEGHQLTPSSSRSYRVDDYKAKEFDYAKFKVMPLADAVKPGLATDGLNPAWPSLKQAMV